MLNRIEEADHDFLPINSIFACLGYLEHYTAESIEGSLQPYRLNHLNLKCRCVKQNLPAFIKRW